jgi:two-component system, OmpR family, phosphate regulon sensor histidine kinase PhoR
MMWWCVATALIVLAAVLFVRRKWIAPWRELEQLVAQIARGDRPRTFLVSGNRHAWRIGVALEDLLAKQRDLDQQLSQTRAENHGIFAALSDAFLVVDADQRVRFSNPAFAQIFAAREIQAGAPLLDVIHDADVIDAVKAALNDRGLPGAEFIRSEKTFELSAVPTKDKSGQITGAIVVLHDISKLKQTDEIRRDFVANVSHELRTPLSIFRGNLEALLDDPNLGREESRHIYSTMKRHSERLNRLVEELLTLARVEANEATVEYAPIDPAAFLHHVARDWSKRLRKKNLTLEVQTEDDLPSIRADEFRLEQIMQNLLDNAFNYSHSGGNITLSATRHDDHVVLSVADEGIGISPQDLPRIFERFYRADKARSRELGSTGLGLSIVKHIAQLHGGDVRAESELGKGTAIRVYLPLAPPEFTQL